MEGASYRRFRPLERLPVKMKPRSLYIHVPFCTRRCSYCDFAVDPTAEPPAAEWLDSICTELKLISAEQGWSDPLELDTVYVGGGTPSLLGTGVMASLRDRLFPHARWSGDAEWTCEANPESFSTEVARDWKAAGVNRVSLGVQTFHEPSLRWMGRLHGAAGAGRAVAEARAAGFDNLSLDLIFGLPTRLGRDWRDDLDRVVELEPEHVSLYGLTAETGAPLGRWVSEGREVLADEDQYAEEYLLAHERLTTAGMEHYEVSNFGRPGHFSRHNFTYWTGDPYLALGPGAHSFLPPVRRWNLRSWSAYREALRRDARPIDGSEVVDAAAAELERAWLLLRTTRPFRPDPRDATVQRLIRSWLESDLAETREGDIRLTPRGWLLLDEMAVALSSVRSGAYAPDRLTDVDDRRGSVQILANLNDSGQ